MEWQICFSVIDIQSIHSVMQLYNAPGVILSFDVICTGSLVIICIVTIKKTSKHKEKNLHLSVGMIHSYKSKAIEQGTSSTPAAILKDI